MTFSPETGGFIPVSLPSPAPSSAYSAATTTVGPGSRLPTPRAQPLKSGSLKESAFINHVDAKLLKIQRRYAKKHSSAFGGNDHETAEEKGYENFREVASDIDVLVDVVWVSGTPSLQIPYLLNLALMVNSYLPDFDFKPQPTLRLLQKLDHAFSSLLQGTDSSTGSPLPGFEHKQTSVSMTEKVRIKAVAEKGRFLVLEARGRENQSEAGNDGEMSGVHEMNETTDDDDFEDVTIGGISDDGTRRLEAAEDEELEIGRVYERTISLLGDDISSSGIM